MRIDEACYIHHTNQPALESTFPVRCNVLIAMSLLAAAALVLIHLFVDRMRFLRGVPRSRWLSIAGGVSVAYVFLHLIPELSSGNQVLAREFGDVFGFIERHVYLISLAGLVSFYGLERMAKTWRRQLKRTGEIDRTGSKVFWIHIASFAAYNSLIAYLLLHLEVRTLEKLIFFAIAMALHIVVTDFGLEEDHKNAYRRIGRWILASAVAVGWIIGYMMDIPESIVIMLTAFLAGGVILNVLKEELPEERESRFGAFLLGAGGYAALLLLL
jgi:hypothetical protein